jgi:lipoprotein signal peptidase
MIQFSVFGLFDFFIFVSFVLFVVKASFRLRRTTALRLRGENSWMTDW